MSQDTVQISQAQLQNMMKFQQQYIEAKEKQLSIESELKKAVCYKNVTKR